MRYMEKKIGNKSTGAGYSMMKTNTGAELQAGASFMGSGIHVDAGYDRKSMNAGAGMSVNIGKKRYGGSFGTYLGKGSGMGKGY